MRKSILALVLTTAVWLALAAAAAADPGAIQVGGQTATTGQQAGAASGAAQVNPSNTNVSIRVLSPGDDGNVTQSNTAYSSATAGNRAATTQNAGQTSGGGSGIQTSQQQAATDQLAGALSTAAQLGASNANLPVRVLSPGNDGSVTQSNSVGSQASAGNAATTGQTSSQSQSGAPCGCDGSGSGIQTDKQSAGTGQAAGALSSATQDHPSNTNVSIRVLSPGNGGSVSQTNAAGSSATAGNAASTTQNASQSQSGIGCGCTTSSPSTTSHDDAAKADPSAATAGPVSLPGVNQTNSDASSATAGNNASTAQGSQQSGSGNGIQVGDQSAATDQHAVALSEAKQIHPSNTSDPVRVLSPGNDGSVSQANNVSSTATAGNSASTIQKATQLGGSCGCSSSPAIQVGGQQSWTGQDALAGSAALQVGASNDASPIRVKSPGDGGSVTQANTVGSSATAGNAAWTTQQGSQSAADGCGCSGAIQVLGQKAGAEQASAALSGAAQIFDRGKPECGCGGGASGNNASPVRVKSPGSDGNVTQTNSVGSSATSGNTASTTQGAGQSAAGSAIQVIGQEAATAQLSFAASLAAQLGASNTASPVRVKSPGSGGTVSQQNSAGSSATSGNAAGTGQWAGQTADGTRCGCFLPPIQVLGQKAETGQAAKALSAAFQLAPSNEASATRVWELMPMWKSADDNRGVQDDASSEEAMPSS
jgi:hypothetical protein